MSSNCSIVQQFFFGIHWIEIHLLFKSLNVKSWLSENKLNILEYAPPLHYRKRIKLTLKFPIFKT